MVSLPHSESTDQAMSLKLLTFNSCLTVHTEESSGPFMQEGNSAPCHFQQYLKMPTIHYSNWKHWDTCCSFKWKDVFRQLWEKPTKWLNTCMVRNERVASDTLLPQAEGRSCRPLSWGISIWPIRTLLSPSVWVRNQLLCLHAFPFRTSGLFLT